MAVEGGTSFCDCDTKVPFENVDLRFEPLIDPSFHHTRYPTVVLDKTHEASIEDQKLRFISECQRKQSLEATNRHK